MSEPALKFDETLSHEEYFALEEEQKYEYIEGEVFVMSRGTTHHALISTNTLISLGIALRDQPCSVLNSDARLYVEEVNSYFHPDIMLLCEEGAEYEKYVTCPRLIIEVLSPSTQDYDHGKKFAYYRHIPCLQSYIMLHQDQAFAEVYQRHENGWLLHDIRGLDATISLKEGINLSLADLYRRIDFKAKVQTA